MILFSVHNLDLVSNFCDKIIFIDNRHSIFECNNPQNFDVLEKIFFDKCVIKNKFNDLVLEYWENFMK